MKIWSWRQAILKSSLPSTTKLVLLALSTYMNDHGEGCYPSQDTIAADTSLSKRAVITHIEVALKAGFLIKQKRNLQGREWDSNEYRASIPSENAPRSPHDEGVNDIHPSEDINETIQERGETDSPHGEPRGEPPSLVGCTTFTRGVKDVHLNSPLNSTMNSSSLRATARDDDALIKIFDEELIKIFGPQMRRRVRRDDHDHSKAYLDAGATPEFFRAVVRDKLEILRDTELDPPQGLVYFRDIVPEELDRAVYVDGLPYYRDQPRPAPKPIELTLAMIGDDTPENRVWLEIMEKLRARHGDAVFCSWLMGLRIKHKNCSVITVSAPSRFLAGQVTEKYGDDIKRLLQQNWPEISTVKIEVRT